MFYTPASEALVIVTYSFTLNLSLIIRFMHFTLYYIMMFISVPVIPYSPRLYWFILRNSKPQACDYLLHVWSLKYVKFCFVLVDGKFSTWSNWGNCSKSCGDGVQVRTAVALTQRQVEEVVLAKGTYSQLWNATFLSVQASVEQSIIQTSHDIVI